MDMYKILNRELSKKNEELKQQNVQLKQEILALNKKSMIEHQENTVKEDNVKKFILNIYENLNKIVQVVYKNDLSNEISGSKRRKSTKRNSRRRSLHSQSLRNLTSLSNSETISEPYSKTWDCKNETSNNNSNKENEIPEDENHESEICYVQTRKKKSLENNYLSSLNVSNNSQVDLSQSSSENNEINDDFVEIEQTNGAEVQTSLARRELTTIEEENTNDEISQNVHIIVEQIEISDNVPNESTLGNITMSKAATSTPFKTNTQSNKLTKSVRVMINKIRPEQLRTCGLSVNSTNDYDSSSDIEISEKKSSQRMTRGKSKKQKKTNSISVDSSSTSSLTSRPRRKAAPTDLIDRPLNTKLRRD